MFRRWYLLLITLLLSLIVLNQVHAYHEDEDEEDVDDDYNYDDFYNGHYEGDGCIEDYEDSQDLKDLEEIVRLLGPKEVTPNGISRIDGQSLILPVVPSNTCSDKKLSNIFTQFMGVIFGDFTGYEGKCAGPLAVKGNFTTTSYIVYPENFDCSNHDSLNAYALVVNGSTTSNTLKLSGDGLFNGGANVATLDEAEPLCSLSEYKGTGLVDFDALEAEANTLNNLYRVHPPTLQLLENGSLKRLADADQGIEYLTFNTCEDRSTCEKIAEGQMSDPKKIFFDGNDWQGIQGDILPDKSMTYVFNIPVIENTVINITSTLPSSGFYICKLIYNFYPVKQSTGEYNPTGVFTLTRSTDVNIEGLVLTPRGKIMDTVSNTFYGNVISLSFFWEGNSQGFMPYRFGNGNCNSFEGCIPDPPQIVTTTSFATTTITEGIKTTTERSTVTTNVEVTQMATVTLKTDGTVTATSIKEQLITKTNYIFEADEDYRHDFKGEWHHKKNAKVDEDDDCDDDNVYKN